MQLIELFYDGGCPLCKKEIDFIRKRDTHQEIRFTDLDDPLFSADAHGKSRDELMARIHARLADGTWITGVEVFRRLYSIIGFKRLVSLSRLPVLRQILDAGYRSFARNRLRWTGRCKKNPCTIHSTHG